MPTPASTTSADATSPRRMASKVDIVEHNAAYLEEHAATLAFSKSSLKFSGYAFLALAVAQTHQKAAPACVDSLAYGIFLLDAARRVSRLLGNESKKSAQDQLTDALESIAQCHSLFAWVTAMLVIGYVLEASGLQAWGLALAAEHDVLNRALAYNESYFYTFKAVVGAAGAVGLRFGGYDYCVNRIKYWGRATGIGREMAAHKIAKVLGSKSKAD